MPRNSVSPPRRSSRYDDDYSRRSSGRNDDKAESRPYRPRNDDKSIGRNRGDEGRNQRSFEDDKGSSSRNYRRDEGRNYGEEDRERERKRDRERYDARSKGGEPSRRNGHPSQRRSASPPSRASGRRDVRSRSGSAKEGSPVEDKAKPNFAPSGLLAAETNTVQAVDGTSTVLKYNEPPEARKPSLGWRLYVFKGSEQVELLHIHRQSAYLIGRDRLVADIAVEHPSCSKQHAAIQYRYIQEKNEFGTSKGVVKPFVIDLESTNGTMVNDERIPPARYYELKASDVLKFGLSMREYVLLNDSDA